MTDKHPRWRATKIAEIPEAEFEAMIESENLPTVSGLRALQRAWNRASELDRVDFLGWILDSQA